MDLGKTLCAGAAGLGLTFALAGYSGAAAAQVESLVRRTAALERRESRLEDANDVKRLQRAYGYYLDRGLWDQAANLFADDGTIEIGLDGVYAGKKRVRQYLYALGGGRSGLPEGRLNEHMQLMGAVTVAPDGKTAKARWRGLQMIGTLGGDAYWGEGPYENEYVKEDGIWKIKSLHWYQTLFVPYAGGWAKNEDANGAKYVSDKLRPDRPP
ncbi:MAG TPA: nuclear transport factor 2 family protein, partial [Gammaproteobacteria bacterium]|nr:nuclear transport factor 2 family protein [Gammaproteobacteria bacterium]